jgi:hypothetical protein
MEDILRVCLLSAHLKLQCKHFLTQVATQILLQKNKKIDPMQAHGTFVVIFACHTVV